MLSMAGLEQKDVEVRMGSVALRGDLRLPPSAGGIVLFAHGSGSSRRSPRNVQVPEVLNRAGLGTLLFDLLTKEEEADRGNVFDAGLLAADNHVPKPFSKQTHEFVAVKFAKVELVGF